MSFAFITDEEIEKEEEEKEEEKIPELPTGHIVEDGMLLDDADSYPSDCFPEDCYRRFPFLAGDDDAPFWQGWANLRLKTFQLIENKYFETAVITMILLSSLALVISLPQLSLVQST